MSGGPAAIFRARILRAVVDVSPCTPYQVADGTALDRICERLVEAEEVLNLLRQNGVGKGKTLGEAVRALLGIPVKT